MKINYLLFFTFLYSFSVAAQEKLEIFFDFNKSELNEPSKQLLSDWVKGAKDLEVSKIYGYCDWKGTNIYNDTLSINRVKAVYHFLINNKISVLENYELKGFGKDFKQSKVQSANRKVTIYYQKKTSLPIPIKTNSQKTLAEKVKDGKIGDVFILENIYFRNRSAIIVPKSKPILYDLLCVMEENPTLKIEIRGHICCQPVSDVEDISTSRAKAVYNFLIRNRINRKRITYKGYGITMPIHPIPEKDDAEADENRRVEIKIIEN